MCQFLQKAVADPIQPSKTTKVISADALHDDLRSTPSTSIPGYRSQIKMQTPDSKGILQRDKIYTSPRPSNLEDDRKRYTTPSSAQYGISKADTRLTSTATADGRITSEGPSFAYDFSSNIHGGHMKPFGASLPDQWRAPKLFDTNETAIMSGIKIGHADLTHNALGAQDVGLLSLLGATVAVAPQQLTYNRPAADGFDEGEDLAAMRRQQAALDRLPRFAPTLQLQQDVKEFKKELRMCVHFPFVRRAILTRTH